MLRNIRGTVTKNVSTLLNKVLKVRAGYLHLFCGLTRFSAVVCALLTSNLRCWHFSNKFYWAGGSCVKRIAPVLVKGTNIRAEVASQRTD